MQTYKRSYGINEQNTEQMASGFRIPSLDNMTYLNNQSANRGVMITQQVLGRTNDQLPSDTIRAANEIETEGPDK
jgi:hypothetical protein